MIAYFYEFCIYEV